MRRWHDSLRARFGWYDAWHGNSGHGFLHWLSFVLAALILAAVVAGSSQNVAFVENEDGDAVLVAAVVPGEVIVQLDPNLPATRVEALMKSVGASRKTAGNEALAKINLQLWKLPDQANERAVARLLNSTPGVVNAEPNGLVEPALNPNDLWFPYTWHTRKISSAASWDYRSSCDPALKVAILDTGFFVDHPDLGPNLLLDEAWDFHNNRPYIFVPNVSNHGTHVAGIVGALTNNSIGIASVPWGCKVLPLKIGNDTNGFASFSAMANALVYAADHNARVANLSYNGVSTSSTVITAARYFYSKGGLVTVAAGNSSAFYSNADIPEIVLVSATDDFDNLASFSNTGNNIDLAAPGVAVRTTTYCTSSDPGRDCYGSPSGTSFSAPIVAGVIAQILSIAPTLTPAQVLAILKQAGDDLGSPGWDPMFGWGRINALKAVRLASGSPPPEDTEKPVVAITSPVNGATVSGVTTVLVNATDNVGVTEVTLFLNDSPYRYDYYPPYDFTWFTVPYPNGTYVLKATARDSNGNVGTSAPVTVTLNNVPDTTAPTVSFALPQDGATISGNVKVSINAADNVAITEVHFYVGEALQQSWIGSWPSNVFTINKFNTKRFANGNHVFRAVARDAAGNETSVQITVQIQNSTGGGRNR